MTPAQHIHVHATHHLGARGRVTVTGVKPEGSHHTATVELTTPHTVETFRAWCGGGAVGMVRTRTTLVPAMPLFATT